MVRRGGGDQRWSGRIGGGVEKGEVRRCKRSLAEEHPADGVAVEFRWLPAAAATAGEDECG